MCFPRLQNHSTHSHPDGLSAFDYDCLTPNFAWHRSLIASSLHLGESGYVFMKLVKLWQFGFVQEIYVKDEQ